MTRSVTMTLLQLICISMLILPCLHGCGARVPRERAQRRRSGPPTINNICHPSDSKGADGQQRLRCGLYGCYTPSKETCCDSEVHAIPSADAVCCLGTAYNKTDDKIPCIRQCGDPFYNTMTQSCRDGKVIKRTSNTRSSLRRRNLTRLYSPQARSTRTRGAAAVSQSRHVSGPVPTRGVSQSRHVSGPVPTRGVSNRKGEGQQYCGRFRSKKPFDPSEQTCCTSEVHDIPTAESVCCGDKAFLKKDTGENPCIRPCGKQRTVLFNTETQLCCGDKVFDRKETMSLIKEQCCGSWPINPQTEICCGDAPVNKQKMVCCENTTPYYPRLLKCDITTKSVLPKPQEWKAQDLSEKISTMRLETWAETARDLVLADMVQLQGRVERCDIKLTKNENFLIIPLSPVMTIQGGSRVSRCIKRRRLRLMIKISDNQKKGFFRKVKNTKRYLRDKTINIYVPSNKFKCRPKKYKTRLTLKPGDMALLLLSQRMDMAWMNSVSS